MNDISFQPLGARKHAFTLIELLVVISITSLLVAILLPALSHARAAANTLVCSSMMRQLVAATYNFAADNQEMMPQHWSSTHDLFWNRRVRPYLGLPGRDVQTPRMPTEFTCPETAGIIRDLFPDVAEDNGWTGSKGPFTWALNGNFSSDAVEPYGPGTPFRTHHLRETARLVVYTENHSGIDGNGDPIGSWSNYGNSAFNWHWDQTAEHWGHHPFDNGASNISFADGHVETVDDPNHIGKRWWDSDLGRYDFNYRWAIIYP